MNFSNGLTHINPHPLADISEYDGYVLVKYSCSFHVLPTFQSLLSFLPDEEPTGLFQMLGYVRLTSGMAEDGKNWEEALQHILPPINALPEIEFDVAYSGLALDNIKIGGSPYYHLHAQLPPEARNFFVECQSLICRIPSTRNSFRNNMKSFPYISLGWIDYDRVKKLSWFRGQISLDLTLNRYRLSEDSPVVRFKPVEYVYGKGQV